MPPLSHHIHYRTHTHIDSLHVIRMENLLMFASLRIRNIIQQQPQQIEALLIECRLYTQNGTVLNMDLNQSELFYLLSAISG